MNLLQIKQKMIDLGISDSYLADCCGVKKYYLKQSIAGSRPMTGKLLQKIEGVFHNLEIKKAAEQRVVDNVKEVSGPIESSKVGPMKDDLSIWGKTKNKNSPLICLAKDMYELYGFSHHSSSFDIEGVHVSVNITIEQKEDY